MAVKKKIVALLDVNEDGQVDVKDMTHIIIRHEWMLVAGLFIFVGAIGNVIGYWTINSDAYWAAAGLAAMLEYIDDTRRIRRNMNRGK
jgi:hypothetical protein|tara:strand:+ start:213 stop:476 length:264 start_codon:yes stop_codon:yes gene_type:complete